jgi:hypothetical protein
MITRGPLFVGMARNREQRECILTFFWSNACVGSHSVGIGVIKSGGCHRLGLSFLIFSNSCLLDSPSIICITAAFLQQLGYRVSVLCDYPRTIRNQPSIQFLLLYPAINAHTSKSIFLPRFKTEQ